MWSAAFEEKVIQFSRVPRTRVWLGDLGKDLTALFRLTSTPAHQEDL